MKRSLAMKNLKIVNCFRINEDERHKLCLQYNTAIIWYMIQMKLSLQIPCWSLFLCLKPRYLKPSIAYKKWWISMIVPVLQWLHERGGALYGDWYRCSSDLPDTINDGVTMAFSPVGSDDIADVQIIDTTAITSTSAIQTPFRQFYYSDCNSCLSIRDFFHKRSKGHFNNVGVKGCFSRILNEKFNAQICCLKKSSRIW